MPNRKLKELGASNLPGKKRGALSIPDMQFIRENADLMSAQQIADALNRHLKPIKKFIDDERIGPDYRQPGKTIEVRRTQGDIITRLRHRPFYEELQAQLSDSELVQFEDNWTTMVVDLNSDILASEELDLKELLVLEILKGRLLKESKIAAQDRDEARLRLSEEMALPKEERDKDAIRIYKEIIATSQNYLSTFNKDLNTLIDKSNKIKQALQQTRAQRTEHLEKAAIDFKTYIIMLEDMETRKRVSREMEIVRMAKNKKLKEFGEYHEFSDGKVDRLVLNAETIESKKTREVSEQQDS